MKQHAVQMTRLPFSMTSSLAETGKLQPKQRPASLALTCLQAERLAGRRVPVEVEEVAADPAAGVTARGGTAGPALATGAAAASPRTGPQTVSTME